MLLLNVSQYEVFMFFRKNWNYIFRVRGFVSIKFYAKIVYPVFFLDVVMLWITYFVISVSHPSLASVLNCVFSALFVIYLSYVAGFKSGRMWLGIIISSVFVLWRVAILLVIAFMVSPRLRSIVYHDVSIVQFLTAMAWPSFFLLILALVFSVPSAYIGSNRARRAEKRSVLRRMF